MVTRMRAKRRWFDSARGRRQKNGQHSKNRKLRSMCCYGCISATAEYLHGPFTRGSITDTYVVCGTTQRCMWSHPPPPAWVVSHLFVEGFSQSFLLARGDLADVLPHPLKEQEPLPVPVRVEGETHADLPGKQRQSASRSTHDDEGEGGKTGQHNETKPDHKAYTKTRDKST